MAKQAKVVEKLRELTRNLWWTWQPNDLTLFHLLDIELWHETNHNPVEFLARIPPEKLEAVAEEAALHSRIDYGFRRLSEYLKNDESWCALHAPALRERPVAYFSMEFGLHESLPIYSGGLGVLAGDHLKSASDLGVPLVGIGILYAAGVLQAVAQRRRVAAGDVSRYRRDDAADRAGARRRRQARPARDRVERRHAARRKPGRSRSGGRRSICSIPTSPRTASRTAP